ncbi:hypothetical protein EJB05_16638, partial [Eragrostis curvula]
MAAFTAKGKAKAKEMDVNDLLQKLRLSEAEKEGVILVEKDRSNLPEVKWMAVAKLLTVKDFSPNSLFNTMLSAWNPAREISFRPIGKNLFTVQAFCLGDWKRIMEEGPWIFRGCALMLEPFDGSTTVPKTIPSKVPAWIQIHKIPHLYRTESIVKQLAARVGEEVMVEMRAVASNEGDFHRAKVLLTASDPLARFVTLVPEGRDAIFLQVKYEKMPRHCAHCGLMGHIHLECGAGEYSEEELQYGEWMLADEHTWRLGTARVRASQSSVKEPSRGRQEEGNSRGGRTSSRPARGRANARGGFRGPVWREKENPGNDIGVSRKRNSEEAGVGTEKEEDIKDTASSPLKMIDEEESPRLETPAAQRKLVLSGTPVVVYDNVPPLPPQYVSPREKKRSRRDATKNSPVKNGAGSLEECRQPQ